MHRPALAVSVDAIGQIGTSEMTHTFLQLTNKLFISQLIFVGAVLLLMNRQGQNFSVWHWILALAAAYVLSAIQAGIVRLLTTRT
jgi:hypothetical protein